MKQKRELPHTDRLGGTGWTSQFIGNSLLELRNSVGLTLPPRAGVLVPKTQILLQS